MFTTMFMLFVLSGTLVVIKLAANCYKNYFRRLIFATNVSVAFFGWIKNDVMVKEKIGKILCGKAFLSMYFCVLFPRRKVRCVVWLCGM